MCPSCHTRPIAELAGYWYSCAECAELHSDDDLWHARMLRAVGLGVGLYPTG